MKKIFRNGLRGVMEEAKEALKECESERERDFVNAALASLEAEKAMLDKFAALAEKKLGSESDPEKRKNLSLIAKPPPEFRGSVRRASMRGFARWLSCARR